MVSQAVNKNKLILNFRWWTISPREYRLPLVSCAAAYRYIGLTFRVFTLSNLLHVKIRSIFLRHR